jgi:ABC-type uncharacterized transport system substrate-binding protein
MRNGGSFLSYSCHGRLFVRQTHIDERKTAVKIGKPSEPDKSITAGTLTVQMAKNATSTNPIVFFSGDPVAAGLVASLARPGGNLT